MLPPKSACSLSSKAFGAAPNQYQYQGDYSEFDDDLGWNDFMLRSYDPQIGRFLQHDPYDQFASGYVGMGNDPGNGTDPSGGLFGVGGVGCAATSGMSGYGGFAGRIAGGLNMGGVLSTAVTMGGIAINGAGLANSISNIVNLNVGSGNQGLSQYANSSSSGPNAGSGDNDGGSSGSDCNCPEGYSTTPKGPNDEPYFFDPDHAAKRWAFAMREFANTGEFEYSSLIFTVTVGSGKSAVTLYAMTRAVRFPDGYQPKGWKSQHGERYNSGHSPGVDDDQLRFHAPRPSRSVIKGLIHFHRSVSRIGVPGGNDSFSTDDYGISSRHPDKFFYVLGALGVLWGDYPTEMPDIRYDGGGIGVDHRKDDVLRVNGGYFNKKISAPSDCKCYKK